MKKNNKRMLVAVLAMAMALSMTACSEEPAEDTSSSEPESSVSEQVSEPETSDLEVEDDTSNSTESETETSDPAAGNTSSSAADAGSSTSSQTQAQAPATTQTSNASSGKGPLANYTVSVQDNSTPAVSVSGRSIDGKSGYYFYSADGDILGYIASNVVSQINRDYKMIQKTDEEHKAWYVEQFNVLRGLEGGSGSTGSGSSGSTGSSSSEIDIEELREEFIRLTNEEREKAGLEPYKVNDVAMEFAQIRAEEISEYFSHERPNGDQTGTYSHYTFGENIVKGGRTAEAAINSLMGSSVHKAAILSTEDEYFGVGVYEKNGTLYWTQEFIVWDSQG